jgi:DNA repair protein RadC
MPQDVVLHILPWRCKKIEHFVAIFLDNKNNIMQKKVISKGTVDQTPVYPREILRIALIKQATGLVIAHNHPGGDPNPSSQDIELTKKIRSACDVFSVRFLDHVIIAKDGHYSFNENGIL